MKKMKTQKGITLIALVITIIVMLILVGVSVTVALNGGLFSTAQKATEETAARRDEELQLSDGKVKIDGQWYNSMDEYVNGTGEASGVKWTQDGTNVTNGTITLKIGEKVEYTEAGVTHTPALEGAGSSAIWNSTNSNYDMGRDSYSTENLEWRVLGVNAAGQLELISTKPTTAKLYLAGKAGYQNAEAALNNFCNDLYGKGEGAASARSLTSEDINKLGNYTPTAGSKYTYQYDPTDATVKGILSSNYTEDMTNSNWMDTGYTEFYSPDWTINSTNVGPYELENTYYYYTVSDKVTITTPVDMAALITKGEGGSSNVTQWLGSRAVSCYELGASFYVRFVSNGDVLGYYLCDYDGNESISGFAVRPVVSLKSDVSLVDENNDGIYEI